MTSVLCLGTPVPRQKVRKDEKRKAKKLERSHRAARSFSSIGLARKELYTTHRRRNQGGRGGHGPPRFQNICFRPPQISRPEINYNQHWLVITFKACMYYSFSSVTFMRVFVRGLCIHSYVEIKELIHNPRLPILLRPPQVVTCSSAPATDSE